MKRLALLVALMLVSFHTYANDVYLSQVAFGKVPEDNTYYTSTITVMNVGSTSAVGQIKVFYQSGDLALSAPFDLPVRGSMRIVTPRNTTDPLRAYWGTVTAGTGTVQATVTFDRRIDDLNKTLITTTSVIGMEAGNSLVVPLEAADSALTGIAIANTSLAGVNVRMRLIAEDGSDAIDNSFPLGPTRQIADFLQTMFPALPKTWKGTMIVETNASSPTLAVTAVTLKEGQFTSLPVISNGSPTIYGTVVNPDGSGAAGIHIYACGVVGTTPCGYGLTDFAGRFMVKFTAPPGNRYLSLNPTVNGCQAYGYASPSYGLTNSKLGALIFPVGPSPVYLKTITLPAQAASLPVLNAC